MASQHIISVEVVQESSFGSIDSSTGRPSASAYAALWKGVEMTRDGLVYHGEPILDMRDNETRSGPHLNPPEPATMYNCATGDAYQHRTGEITLNLKLRAVGDATAYTAPREMPWVQILESGMELANATGTTDAVTATVDANNFTPTTLGDYDVGNLIAVSIDGRLEFSTVTAVSANITHSPAFSRSLAPGDTVRMCDTLVTANDLTVGSSVALRMTTTEGQELAFGCRMSAVTFSVENSQLTAEVTLQSAHVEDAHSGPYVPADTDFSDGHLPHLLGSYAIYSDAITSADAAPFEKSRTVLPVKRDSFTMTITNTLAEKGYSGSLLSTSDFEVADSVSSAEVMIQTPDTNLDDDLWDQVERSYMFGFAPCGVGEGLGIFIGAGHNVIDVSKRAFEDDIIQQSLSLRPGDYNGDDDSVTACNCDVKIGMVVA